MYIKKIIPLLIIFSLVACQKAENKTIPIDFQQKGESKLDNNILISKYKNINFPLDSKVEFSNGKFINLDQYPLNIKDLKLFYSGEEQARILMTTVKKIGNKDYLLGLVAINFNDYEGAGPAQVVFLAGGKNIKNNYKNTLFFTMGGKFPLLDNEVKKINNINESKLKNYCLQSFVLNNDLSKKEEMRCVGDDPSIEKKKFIFDTSRLGFDEI